MLRFILTVITMMLFSIAFSQKSGKATYYHDKYHGRKSADGSIFSQSALTCASNVYKLGTKLKVTNKENGKTVVVKVTDKGPFKSPKIVDLSKAAFREISTLKRGIISVIVEKLE